MTQDYSETLINDQYGDEVEVPRLKIIIKPFGYGFQIVDMKSRLENYDYDGPEILGIFAALSEAKAARDSLLQGKDFTKKQILRGCRYERSNSPFYPTRIIKFEKKYGDQYYSVPTLEELKKVALKEVEERNNMGYFFKPQKPQEIGLTKKIVGNLPPSLQKEGKSKLLRYKKDLYQYKKANKEYQLVEEALQGDSSAALKIIESRCGYEYEKYEIIDPLVIK